MEARSRVAGVRRGQRVLDLASGTGDISARFSGQVGEDGQVVMSDINAAMLTRGRDRLTDRGLMATCISRWPTRSACPSPTDHFDCVTIGFGLRNVTHKEWAIAEMYRVLRPGGRGPILEFSHPTQPGLQPHL